MSLLLGVTLQFVLVIISLVVLFLNRKISEDDARRTFQLARSNAKNFAVVFVEWAQFELSLGWSLICFFYHPEILTTPYVESFIHATQYHTRCPVFIRRHGKLI